MQLRKLLWHFNLDLKRFTFNKIGFFSYMGPAISLVGQKRISIGNRVRIYPGCRMETHDNGEIIINDDCSIAQNFHITSSELPLVIGAKTTILGNVL